MKKPRKNPIPNVICAVAWYSEDQWHLMRQVAVDPERLEEAYSEWLKVYENSVKDFKAHGMLVKKAKIDVEALVVWCIKEKRLIDAEARSHFAALTFQREERS
jgi:hypothetical protein